MARNRNRPPRIIIDWDKCINVQPGDELLAQEMHPYKCPVCTLYSGKLSPVSMKAPVCDDHDEPIVMEKVDKS